MVQKEKSKKKKKRVKVDLLEQSNHGNEDEVVMHPCDAR